MALAVEAAAFLFGVFLRNMNKAQLTLVFDSGYNLDVSRGSNHAKTHVSTPQASSESGARLQGKNEHPRRSQRPEASHVQRPAQAGGVTLTMLFASLRAHAQRPAPG